MSEPRSPNITLSPDVQTFAIHGKQLHLPTLQAGLRKKFDMISKELDDVLLHQDLPFVIPSDLPDDMANTTRGYSWLDNGQFTDKQYPMLEGYLNDPNQQLCWEGRDGKLHFHAAGCSTLMKKTASVNRGISVLNDIVNSLPARSTEFTDHKIRNSWRRRNGYRDQGKLHWVNQYSKKSNIRKMDTFLPVLVADEMQTLQEKYLIFVRPVEELIARELWGEEARVLYNEYMYVEMGKRVEPDMFSRHLKSFMEEFVGVSIGVEELRQVSVSIMREYIPAESHYAVMGNNVGDLIQDHLTSTSHGSYACLDGSLPYLTTDAMFKYDDFCTRWHCVTGFGKHPPPHPLRLIRSSGPVMYVTPSRNSVEGIPITNSNTASGSGDLMQMMQLLLAKVTNLEVQMATQAATTSTNLQEFRVQTKNDIKDSMAECFAAFEASGGAAKVAELSVPNCTEQVCDDAPMIMERSPSPELEYGPRVDVALNAIRLLLAQPDAEYRSKNQKAGIQHCLQLSSNLVAVMSTGEGKSMMWQVCAKLQQHIKNVVIISSSANLMAQLQRAKDMGLSAGSFRFSDHKDSKHSFGDKNLIFVAMETAADQRFHGLVVLPLHGCFHCSNHIYF